MIKKALIVLGILFLFTIATSVMVAEESNSKESLSNANSGVKVEVSANIENTATTEIVEDTILSNGNFVAGKDFKEGIYTITALEGNGNVMSSNVLDGGINAIMGIGGSGFDGIAQKEYKNIKLSKDVTLTLNNVKVNLKYIRAK